LSERLKLRPQQLVFFRQPIAFCSRAGTFDKLDLNPGNGRSPVNAKARASISESATLSWAAQHIASAITRMFAFGPFCCSRGARASNRRVAFLIVSTRSTSSHPQTARRR
jgi:hypothetical protein